MHDHDHNNQVGMSHQSQAEFLLDKLNEPIQVCH